MFERLIPPTLRREKMKKIGLLFFATFLLGAGMAYFFLRAPVTATDTAYADYLPADTLAIMSLRDLSGLIDLFPGTALGHFLSKETMAAILGDMQVGPEAVIDYEKSYDQVFSVLHNPAFRMVFGDDVELAWLAVDPEKMSDDPQEFIEQSFIILATTTSGKALETFAHALLHEDVDMVKSGDLQLTRIRLDAGNYVYAYSEGSRLLLALDPVVISRCVAVRNTGKTLQQEKNFIAAVGIWQASSLQKTYSREFVQLDRLSSYLSGAKDKDLRQVGRYLQGMEFVASTGGRIAGGWKVESTGRYSYDGLDPAVRELIDAKSDKNTSLHLLLGNPLFYSWSSSLGVSTLLQGLSATDAAEYKKLDRRLQRELDLSLAQITGAFGPQYGMVLKKIVQGGLFPLPRIVLFVQVRDHKVAGALLDRIRQKAADQGMKGAGAEQIGPYTLYSWALLPGEATQPAFVLTRDMLYLANGPSSLKQVLGMEKDRARLPEPVAEKLGAPLADQVRQANNGAVIFWPSRFAAQVKGAADWLAGIVAASQGKSIEKLKDELLLLMQSTEKAVFVSDLFVDHARAEMTVNRKSITGTRQ
jgi:hypothetical protein